MVDLDSVTFPLHTILIVLHLYNFIFVPNTRDYVLPKWGDNLSSINQSFTVSGSELKVASIPTMSLPESSKTESSAYNNSLHLTVADMSYIKEIIGAK